MRCTSTYHGERCEVAAPHPHSRHAFATSWDDEGRVDGAAFWTDAEADQAHPLLRWAFESILALRWRTRRGRALIRAALRALTGRMADEVPF